MRFDGDLAALLVIGGAYRRFRGDWRTAKAVALRAADELLDGRLEDFAIFYSEEAWSPWFFDVAWDESWILLDEGHAEATIIVTTDTD